MHSASTPVDQWSPRLCGFIPGFFRNTPALRPLLNCCSVVLHGSTTLGLDDAFSDLDLWVLSSPELVGAAESAAGTRFFSFTLDDKPGHFNLETLDEATERIRSCDLERIAELRMAHVLVDDGSCASTMLAAAAKPMAESVRHAWFCYHYVEMRGFHRNCDNPMERRDSLGLLQGIVPTLNHAMRAAMVLDAQPYPYTKWLGTAARNTPTGRQVMPLVDEVLNLLNQEMLSRGGSEREHPIGLKLREIRQVLIDAARAGGLNELWLDRWWIYLTQARAGITRCLW